MIGLGLSINLANSNSSESPPGPPQFTADWGNLNTIDDITPVVFWASTSGAVTDFRTATVITFSGLGGTKSITLTRSGSGTAPSSIRYRKNGTNSTYSTPFTVVNGDTLAIGFEGPNFLGSIGSGTLTVTNSTDAYTIDTISYTINVPL